MSSTYDFFADIAEAEFRGESYNGKPLMATLAALEAPAASAETTFEGYSAWSVALHVGYCSWVVARSLLDEEGRKILGSWPWPIGNGGFTKPDDEGEASWKAVLEGLARAHEAALAAIRTAPEAAFDRMVEEWDIPAGKAVAWLATHYAYHNGQIRSMGCPGIGPAKRVY